MGTALDEDKVSTNQNEKSKDLVKELEVKVIPTKVQYLTAAAIFLGAVTFGCAYNTYGPVITSLQHKYDTDDATISKVFSILTGCYLIGGLGAGVIYNHVNRQLAVICIHVAMAAIMFVTPHCPTLTTFFISGALMGICSGAYDAAQVVWIMEMMQKECPPYVMSQHFFYAVGTNLASLILAPFLDEDEEDDPQTKIASLLSGDNDPISKVEDDSGSNNKLFIPYIIFGILVSVSALAQALLFIFMRYYPPPPEKNEVSEKGQLKIEDQERNKEKRKELFGYKIWSWPKIRMVLLSACFFGAYQGMEMCTFQFFPKFGQNSDLALAESESAYVLTGMTAAFAVGRGLAIVAIFKIPAQVLLFGNLALVAIADVILVGWAKRSLPMLWTSSILFGLGFSSMYPAFCTFIERYLNFTNFIGSMMIVSGSGVAAIYPLIVGSFVEDNPIVLSYVAFFSIALLLFALGTLSYITHKNKTRY